MAVVKTKDGDIDKLIIRLQRKDVGAQNRRQYPGLTNKYPESVIIERVTVNYAIRKRGGNVGSTATLIQFPIKLAHAITSHKIQGQTVPKPLKVAYDIASVFEEAQGYVMLSRVQELKQVYIIDKFDPKKIYPSKKALVELDRMNRISINQNPGPWDQSNETSVKIACMNCAGLKAHFVDIKADEKLLKADIIHLIETSLSQEESTEDFDLRGYTKKFITTGNGKGIASYYDEAKFTPITEVKREKFQVAKFAKDDLDIITIYRSQTGNSMELLETLKTLIEPKQLTLITGDFNICFIENSSNRLIQGLLSLGFDQRVHEPTHIKGRHIDQVYILDQKNKLELAIDRYSSYYSDHDAILITLSQQIQEI